MGRFIVGAILAIVDATCDVPAELTPPASHKIEILQGPQLGSDLAEQRGWLESMKAWRGACRREIHFNGSIYENEALKWTQTSYFQPQMHPYDRLFYDPVEGKYTVSKWLADLTERYGGIDSALIWPTYPDTGIDDRSQFDLIQSLPGGMEGIRGFVTELQAAGVKVLWAYLPWDHGTNRTGGSDLTDAERVAKLLASTGADGFNADSTSEVSQDFWDASVAAGRPAAMEPEDGGTPESTNWDTIGWGYWGENPYQGGGAGTWPTSPAIDKFKWLDARRMTHISDRWNKGKTDNLQSAYFNGIGYETWENIWGIWNGVAERDGEALRRVGHILRFFGAHNFLTSPDWEPHTPTVKNKTVFASRWPRDGDTLWTLVHRNDPGYSPHHGFNAGDGHGAQDIDSDATAPAPITLAACEARCDADSACDCVTFEPTTATCWKRKNCVPSQFNPDPQFDTYLKTPGHRIRNEAQLQLDTDDFIGASFYDCYRGKPLEQTFSGDGSSFTLDFEIESWGYGCVLAAQAGTASSPLIQAFLANMSSMTERPLSEYSSEWTVLPQVIIPDLPPLSVNDAAQSLTTMMHIPAGTFHFQASGVELEGDDAHGVDVQFPWESSPRKIHDHVLQMESFLIDPVPVTCGDFAAYLKASNFTPKSQHHFLRNWKWDVEDTPTVPPELTDVPVTYVSFHEAQEFCSFYGKRLPSTWEWQYAGQGNTGHPFPWGPEDDVQCRPSLNSDTQIPGAHRVDAYLCGASVFNVSDMIGNVWQYTSAFQDKHTRYVVLKGGSNYHPSPSKWYYPQARQLDLHNKMFLMDASYERAGTVGFRCAQDLQESGGDRRSIFLV